jgi:hypothetical protein
MRILKDFHSPWRTISFAMANDSFAEGERFQNPANELLFLKKKKSKEFYGFQKFSYEVSVPPKSL